MNTNVHAHHSHSPTNHNRMFGIGVFLNVLFVVIELFYGWRADSLALISDAVHNLSDVLGLLLAWAAVWLGQLRPSPKFTYGWQRASIMAALINALLLLLVMGGVAWEAWLRLHNPAPIVAGTVIWVALAGIIVNSLTAYLFHHDAHHDINIHGAFLHMAGDALVSAGVVIAGLIYLKTGWQWLDPAISIAIAVIVLWSSFGLLQESMHLSLDAVPKGIDVEKVHSFLLRLDGVKDVHDLHIWPLSTSRTALTAHVVMRGEHPGNALMQEIAEELEAHFDIAHSTIQIEVGGRSSESS